MLVNSVVSIMGTRGVKAASVWRQCARDCQLVEPDERQHHEAGDISWPQRQVAQARLSWMFVISLKLSFHGDLLAGERVSRVPLISPGIVA